MAHFPRTRTATESEAEAGLLDRRFVADGFGPWALERAGRFVGFAGAMRILRPLPFPGGDRPGSTVELAWRLARDSWGLRPRHARRAARPRRPRRALRDPGRRGLHGGRQRPLPRRDGAPRHALGRDIPASGGAGRAAARPRALPAGSARTGRKRHERRDPDQRRRRRCLGARRWPTPPPGPAIPSPSGCATPGPPPPSRPSGRIRATCRACPSTRRSGRRARPRTSRVRGRRSWSCLPRPCAAYWNPCAGPWRRPGRSSSAPRGSSAAATAS